MTYKNASKENKEEIQYHLKQTPLPTLKIILKRLKMQIDDL